MVIIDSEIFVEFRRHGGAVQPSIRSRAEGSALATHLRITALDLMKLEYSLSKLLPQTG
jgi:hypothetical protein